LRKPEDGTKWDGDVSRGMDDIPVGGNIDQVDAAWLYRDEGRNPGGLSRRKERDGGFECRNSVEELPSGE
jgi:hypothetical protein